MNKTCPVNIEIMTTYDKVLNRDDLVPPTRLKSGEVVPLGLKLWVTNQKVQGSSLILRSVYCWTPDHLNAPLIPS